MSIVRWFVNYGPDKSHMFECRVFDSRKESREFCALLQANDREAGRKERPYNVERAEYKKSGPWGDTVSFSIVEKNY